jgi:hypothetical protein
MRNITNESTSLTNAYESIVSEIKAGTLAADDAKTVLLESINLYNEATNAAKSYNQAVLTVSEALYGGLSVSQMFQQWGIENAKASELFASITEGGITKKELEEAVDAFHDLGIEGDSLTTIINYLTDSFVTASEEMTNALNSIDSILGDLPTTENQSKTALDEFLNEMANFTTDLPSLSEATDPGYSYIDVPTSTPVLDETGYYNALKDATSGAVADMTMSWDNWDDSITNETDAEKIVTDIYASIGRTGDILSKDDENYSIYNIDKEGFDFWKEAILNGSFSTAKEFSENFYDSVGSNLPSNLEDLLVIAQAIGATDSVNKEDFTTYETGTTQEIDPNSGYVLQSSEKEISAALDLLESFEGSNDYQGLIDAVGSLSPEVLSDIFREDTSDNLSALNTTYSNYLASLDSGTSSDGTPDESDYDSDQLSNLVAQIQYDLDTINLSNIEKEFFDIDKQVNEWNISLTDLGYSLSDAEELTGAWSEAQKNVLRESLTSDWQGIIDQNTLSDVELQMEELKNWYIEQMSNAEALGMETDTLTEAYKVQKKAMEDSIMSPFENFAETSGMSDIEKELYNIDQTASNAKTSLEEMGRATKININIIDDWAESQKEAMKDSLTVDWQGIIDQNTLSDIDLKLLNLDKWYNEQLASAEALGMETDTLTEAYKVQKKAMEDSLTVDWQGIIDQNTLSDVDLKLLNLDKWYNEQLASAEALGMETDTLTEAYKVQKDAITELAKSDYLNYLQEEINIRQAAYDEAKTVLENYISDEEALIEARRNASESINDFIDNLNKSDKSPVQSLEYFEKRYAQLLSEAQNASPEDIENAVSNLTSFTNEYLDFAGDYGGQDYNSLFNSVVGDLEALGVDQINAADAQEKELKEIQDLIGITNEELFDLEKAIQEFKDAEGELDDATWMTEELEKLESIDDNLSLLYQAQKAYYDSIDQDIPNYTEPSSQSIIDRLNEAHDANVLYDSLFESLMSPFNSDGIYSPDPNSIYSGYTLDDYDSYLTELGFANGGIASGPMSGYPVTLHGTEAIIPLNNGSIPVEINSNNQDIKVIVKIGDRELKDITTEVIRTDPEAQRQVRRVANG